jgi:hypothetical protein
MYKTRIKTLRKPNSCLNVTRHCGILYKGGLLFPGGAGTLDHRFLERIIHRNNFTSSVKKMFPQQISACVSDFLLVNGVTI